MSATGEHGDSPFAFDHPAPELDDLELDSGDKVLYDTENPDAWLQIDPCHMLRLDGRWR